jgi:hypothetical protein
VAVLTGRHFFPDIIAGPFHHGLVIVFIAAAAMSIIGALVSLMRGRQFIYDEGPAGGGEPQPIPGRSPAPPNYQGSNGNAPTRLAPDVSARVAGAGGPGCAD